MDYDFSSLNSDQLEKLVKKLDSFNESLIKSYKITLNVINNSVELDHRDETIVELEDELRDVLNHAHILYAKTLNKCQELLVKYL